MKLSLTLLDDVKTIEKNIVRALHREVATLLIETARRAEPKIKAMVKRRILAQPEVQSLIEGKLRAEFGVPDGLRRIGAIVDYWCEGIKTSFSKRNQFTNKFEYSFTISMIPSNYNDAIKLAEANVKISDGSLPWLEWLLKFGDKVIVRDYDVRFTTNADQKSRTGDAVMVKGPNRQWGVPSEYAGTIDNNFVTRALADADEEVLDILEQSMRESI